MRTETRLSDSEDRKAFLAIKKHVQESPFSERLSPLTNNIYYSYWNRYCAWLGNRRIGTLKGVRSFVKMLEEGGIKRRTVSSYISSVINYVKRAVDEEVIPIATGEHYIRKLRVMRNPNSSLGIRVAHTPSVEEVRHLIDTLSGSQRYFQKLLGMTIEALACSGMRVTEILSARIKDVTTSRKTPTISSIRIVNSKGKKRLAHLPSQLVKDIKKHCRGKIYLIELQSGGAYKQPHISHEMSRVSQRLIGAKLTPQQIRYFYVAQMIRQHAEPDAINAYLGYIQKPGLEDEPEPIRPEKAIVDLRKLRR